MAANACYVKWELRVIYVLYTQKKNNNKIVYHVMNHKGN